MSSESTLSLSLQGAGCRAEGVVALWRPHVATVGMSDTLCLSYVIVSVFPSLTL